MNTKGTRLGMAGSTAIKHCAWCGDGLYPKEGERPARFAERKFCDRACFQKSHTSRKDLPGKERLWRCQVDNCKEKVGKGLRFLCDHHFATTDLRELEQNELAYQMEGMAEYLWLTHETQQEREMKAAMRTLTVCYSEAEYTQEELEFYLLMTRKERQEIRRSYDE